MLRTLLCLFVTVGLICPAASVWAQQKDLSSTSVQIDSTLIERSSSSLVNNSVSHLISDTSLNVAGDSAKTITKAPIVSKPISLKAVLIPTAMIGYGAFALSNKELKSVNLAVRKGLWEDRNNGNGKPLHIDNFSLMAPAVAVYVLNAAGVKGKNNFIDRSLLYGMSNLIGTGIVSSVKRLSDEIRPDSSNYLSFPSGHTTRAFIAAEFMRQEYKHLSPWYGIAGYAVAAGTGFLRMYNNKHWLNDVIAGAGVGILSTRISYWLYPKMKNLFVKEGKEKSSHTMIMPTYQNGAIGLGMVHSF
ncbi:phosphatase PAP2 family protein [Chitinophagaceae bacterium LB-8]|uniref:Phosphatase PAP2 family protein n=1 Tax=Paraflavisolibacter caeni TaxID=2982496 RepID=A0A9X3B692_9BACT|nr:phosphatase PAP2 family protein [Paraflavisolibacter caeni]MCU7547670.1 phosphatase PAP2 family protein [Paraflavisolibacter caeni]